MTILVNDIRRNFYADSVALMRLSRSIASLPEVVEAALMMATPANKQILRDASLLAEGSAQAGPNDLILAVRAATEIAARAALAEAAEQLAKPRTASTEAGELARPRSLRAALRSLPDASLALISVPGDYAAAEARKAIRAGLDVMMFSDNVSLDDEVALKREADALGRLVMGPDCGTAIISGVPLAFANRVPRGAIGVIGASGTGTQEITCLVARAGHGISQAIGVGGRDLSQAVGGITTLRAIDLLDADPATQHIVLVSKPPHPDVAGAVLGRVGKSRKPFTICFLGAKDLAVPANAQLAPTLAAAAALAVGQSVAKKPSVPAALASHRGPTVGLYSGGTLCAEAQLILLQHGRRIVSNAPVPGAQKGASAANGGDLLLDLGADEYTRGRPHPMIDPAVRLDQLRRVLDERRAGAVLLDVVIGYGAHDNPAQGIADAVNGARSMPVIASVTGTEDDPQVRSRQVAILRAAGVTVAESNAEAAEMAAASAQP